MTYICTNFNTLYRYLIRPLLFLFDPEKVHLFTIEFLSLAHKIPGVKALIRNSFSLNNKGLKREVFGLSFANPVGLAAGFDKDAQMIDLLEPFGFGSIEIGTLTPKPQPGNEKQQCQHHEQDTSHAGLAEQQYGVVVVLDAEQHARVEQLRSEVALPVNQVGCGIRVDRLSPRSDPGKELCLAVEQRVARVGDQRDAVGGLGPRRQGPVEGRAAQHPGVDQQQ